MSMLDDILDGLLAFGRVARSVQSGRARAVLLDILGDRGPAGDERHDERAAWGLSPILYRPAPPDNDGAEEVVFLRRGDDAVILASRDLRWQVEVREGETVVRGLGEGAAMVRLRPDGSAVLVASKLEIVGTDGAAAPLDIPRDDLVQAELAKIAATLATGSNSGGPVVFGTPYTRGDTASERLGVDS